jgi:hypothetical protein
MNAKNKIYSMIGLKPGIKWLLSCPDLKVGVIEKADIMGFSPNIFILLKDNNIHLMC